MDPNANVVRQRELAHEILDLIETIEATTQYVDEHDMLVQRAGELADVALALDTWRSAGGFDPYKGAPDIDGSAPITDRGLSCAQEFDDLFIATAQAHNLPIDDSPGGVLVDIGTRLAGYVRSLAARARAWERMDDALLRNARGESHYGAADVCATGFQLQEQLKDRP